MTCNNCIHYELCEVQAFNGFNKNWDPEKDWKHCGVFKDKSKYIELPCKVGDTVYAICYASGKIYIRREYVHFLEYSKGSNLEKWRIHTQYMVRSPEELYYTKNEAEAKLKELNENAKI